MKYSINTHSSIRIEDKKVIYFDPFEIKEETHDSDIVFFTHDHYDHFSIEDVKRIANENTIYICPKSCLELVEANLPNEKIYSLLPNEKIILDGISIETVPSYNLCKDYHRKEREYLGYIITLSNKRIYVTGDSDLPAPIISPKCDILFIPIGGKYTYDIKEASEFTNIIHPKIVIPTHYGNITGTKDDGKKFKRLIEEDIQVDILI